MEKKKLIQVIYTSPITGKKEIRYSAIEGSKEAGEHLKDVAYHRLLNANSPYSIEMVDSPS